MKSKIIISPSLLAADFSNLKKEIEKVTKGKADWLHLDIMDGVFVPNISFGPSIVKTLRPLTDLFFDVHLMIINPIRYIDTFADAGAQMITFHVESCDNPEEVINKIHLKGIKAGIALKPGTDIKSILSLIPLVDMVLIMTVEPGFGGQKYMPEMERKISDVKSLIEKTKREIFIQVDGGISSTTVKGPAQAGANVFVAGTAIFKSADTLEAVEQIRNIAAEAQK